MPLRLLGLVALAGALGLAPALQARPHAPPDSVVVPTWARHLASVDRQTQSLKALEAAGDRDGATSAAERLMGSLEPLEDEQMLRSPRARAVLVAAHAAVEPYAGALQTAPLHPHELWAVRGPALQALAEGAPFPAPPIAEAPPPPEPEVVLPAVLQVPEGFESAVAAEVAWFNRSRGHVRGVQRRARRLFPMIERSLRARGVPRELKYVAVIESGLDAGAVSPAGALGLWQFMPDTGDMYGLDSAAVHTVGPSTRAAARHLRYLGRLFDGDWHLALAAYNWGPGNVQRVVRRESRRLGRRVTYWDIHRHLPRETRRYVPRLIAAVRVFER